jgi:hypothetical protein
MESKIFYNAVKSSYKNKAFSKINDYINIYDGLTLDAFLNKSNNNIIIGIKGTTDLKDIISDVNLVINNLKNSSRYKTSLMEFKKIIQNYNPKDYNYYLAGHSLGGAIAKEIIRDYNYIIKEAILYNSASQPIDLIYQNDKIKEKYINKDFLYNLTGKFIKNKDVIKYKEPKTDGLLNKIKSNLIPTSVKAHKLENFEGTGINNIKKVSFIKSPIKNKRYRAIFYNSKNELVKFIDFGSKMENYTMHKDNIRKDRWLKRFNSLIKKESNNYLSPITLSHLILWNKINLKDSINDYKKKFKLH